MPSGLRSIANEKATVTVPIDPRKPDGETFRITYRTGAVNAESFILANDASSAEGGGFDAAAGYALAWFESWDLKWDESDPEPIPLTREDLRKVPLSMLDSWCLAVLEDTRPDPKAKKTSRGR